jgi:hypothetical protein
MPREDRVNVLLWSVRTSFPRREHIYRILRGRLLTVFQEDRVNVLLWSVRASFPRREHIYRILRGRLLTVFQEADESFPWLTEVEAFLLVRDYSQRADR